jgi:hypothetical protein
MPEDLDNHRRIFDRYDDFQGTGAAIKVRSKSERRSFFLPQWSGLAEDMILETLLGPPLD